ncbi:MAG: HD domain-containing protein [Lachnospiraceae bacterium]|nr:HD domain-containing protein [Lachnospiraceae bacterium]
MMEFLRAHQLNFMQALTGICGVSVFLLLITKAIAPKRRRALILMELTAMFLLIFDRLAYIYAGDVSRTGYYMVRISNFIVFFLTSEIVFAFNNYLKVLLWSEKKVLVYPKRIKIVDALAVIGMVMAIVAAFTGLYYYFDEANHYHRGPLFLICYIIPVVAPIIQLALILQYKKFFSKWIFASLMIFLIGPIVASIIQLFAYGLSLTNIMMVLVAVFMYVFAYIDINEAIEKAHANEIEELLAGRENAKELFDRTTGAFMAAIDAKNEYTRGHSKRVAEYARRIAVLSGKNEEECEEIYYSALLHDVGKLGLPDSVLEKGEEMTEAEHELVKQKTVIGDQILSDISDFPYLREAAHYSHERYDGTGYPEGLKGEEIPESARIVAVASAYDTMTTANSKRDPMPDQVIREKFIRESGKKFDPRFAGLIIRMIDEDSNFQIISGNKPEKLVLKDEYVFDEYKKNITPGVVITYNVEQISLRARPTERKEGEFFETSLILFDSYDGRVHDNPESIATFRYIEYGEIWLSGNYVCTSARNMDVKITEKEPDEGEHVHLLRRDDLYTITLGRYRDHLQIKIENDLKIIDVIVALPDNSRWAYVAFSGEHAHIDGLKVSKTGDIYGEGDIRRIAKEIDFTDRMESDLPNIQIDTTRSAATKGVPLTDGLRIAFHTMSLPSANLIWHCPYIVIYHSDDGKVGGPNSREYALIKLNGESTGIEEFSENTMNLEQEDFKGWEEWEKINKRGMECLVTFRRRGNRIISITKNAGIEIENLTVVKDGQTDLYVALTGDQCVLTDIRIM